MQHSAADLLRRLRPDNFAAFAELFTAAVLQVRWAWLGMRTRLPTPSAMYCLRYLHVAAGPLPRGHVQTFS